jgi:hypothetical protein
VFVTELDRQGMAELQVNSVLAIVHAQWTPVNHASLGLSRDTPS